jgi:hypothetical protein
MTLYISTVNDDMIIIIGCSIVQDLYKWGGGIGKKTNTYSNVIVPTEEE